ncbi:MAG TPA: YbaB/EbfC family nucleoid-associated protein [Dongiaceae bacterium]
MKNLSQMLKQAQEMQSKMAEMQAALADIEIVGQSGGGFVAVTVNGKGELKRVKIDPKLVDPSEVAVLEDLIVAAARDAKAKADAAVQEQMAKLTGGLQLPPGFKLPF